MPLMMDDTIAAIATPPGEGGISIVRISGPEAFAIADRIVRCPGSLPSQRAENTLVVGQVVEQAQVIDEVVVLLFRAPHSYTAEDVIEIQGHGGNQCARRILRLVLDAGALLAEPGEFTRRAFLHGRIDLVQAEAVLDLIRAHSDRAGTAAVEQLEGALSRKLNLLYDALLMAAARLEATLDFPEDELPDLVMKEINAELQQINHDFDALIDTWDEGHLLRDGALVVISGKPNVGKSTLLNGLLEKDRAIVSDLPGTTRDSIEETFILNGIPVRIADTAGLRDTTDLIEKEGIERTHRMMRAADLLVYLFDLTDPDLEQALEGLKTVETPHLVIFNKLDMYPGQGPDLAGSLCLSLLQETGIQQVRDALSLHLSGNIDLSARPHALISERHRRLLLDAKQEMEAGLELVRSGREDGLVLAASQMRLGLQLIGQATGRAYEEELLDNIFGRFCIGK
jgi:tRNA modification GTPase